MSVERYHCYAGLPKYDKGYYVKYSDYSDYLALEARLKEAEYAIDSQRKYNFCDTFKIPHHKSECHICIYRTKYPKETK